MPFVPSSFLLLVVRPGAEPLVASLLLVAMPGAPSSEHCSVGTAKVQDETARQGEG